MQTLCNAGSAAPTLAPNAGLTAAGGSLQALRKKTRLGETDRPEFVRRFPALVEFLQRAAAAEHHGAAGQLAKAFDFISEAGMMLDQVAHSIGKVGRLADGQLLRMPHQVFPDHCTIAGDCIRCARERSRIPPAPLPTHLPLQPESPRHRPATPCVCAQRTRTRANCAENLRMDRDAVARRDPVELVDGFVVEQLAQRKFGGLVLVIAVEPEVAAEFIGNEFLEHCLIEPRAHFTADRHVLGPAPR